MPRTLAQNAQYIAETIKPAIKQAIEDKGVTVPSTDSFLDYADRIGEIEGGGSGYQLKDLPTGAISTVNDATELPLNALKVSVEAQQDLHGYDHPWVGGAGKNKLPLVLADIKTANTRGTWSGDTYNIDSISYTLITDDDDNVIGIKADGTSTVSYPNLYFPAFVLPAGQYVLSGCPAQTGSVIYITDDIQATYSDASISFTLTEDTTVTSARICIVNKNHADNAMFYPMIRLSSASADFAPYSNICHIEGWDSGEITVCDDIQNPTQTKTTSLDFPTTIYGAEWDVINGELGLKITDGFYESYNGEALPGVWMSDRDVYQAGTTPTIGAQVKYKLATPTYVTLTGLSIRLLEGTNNLYADCGEVLEGEYFVDEGAIDVRKVDYQIGASGSIKTTDGRVLSGFASMNGYHARPLDASGNWLDVDWSKDFEVCVAFKTSSLTNSQFLFGSGIANTFYHAPYIGIYQGGNVEIACYYSGSTTPAFDVLAGVTLQTDKWYAIKVVCDYTNDTFVTYLSEDLSTWTAINTQNLTNTLRHDSASLGLGGLIAQSQYSSNNLLIDTFNTYIKGDGVNWGASTGAFPS